MAKRSNAKLIGVFVVGAVALVIVGVLSFGGMQLFTQKGKFVLFFQGSLAGLNVGSPVTFRGITIGSVTNVVIQYDIAKQRLRIPVFIEIDPTELQIYGGERNPAKNLRALIDRGLRARLETVSLVTGQASINFDIHKDAAPPVYTNADLGVEELPTIPSEFDVLKASLSDLLAKVNQLPLEKIIDDVMTTLTSANQVLKDSDAVVKGAASLVTSMNEQVTPLSQSVIQASAQASDLLKEATQRLQLSPGEPMQKLNDVLDDARRLVGTLNGDLPRLIGPAVKALDRAAAAVDQVNGVLVSAQRLISPGSPVFFELVGMLTEGKGAARAIRIFAEYIQRNPNALLMGNK